MVVLKIIHSVGVILYCTCAVRRLVVARSNADRGEDAVRRLVVAVRRLVVEEEDAVCRPVSPHIHTEHGKLSCKTTASAV